ncbi:MAG: DGQHR domain-containing protein [Methanospirillum sp.]
MVRTSAASKRKDDNPKPISTWFEGLVSGDGLDRVFAKRNKKYLEKTLVKQDITAYQAQGWEREKSRSKKTIKLRKLKDIGPGFEDELWCILYQMGFEEMNADSSFQIPRFNQNVTKQIDIFARDEHCICLIECKASEESYKRRNLDKDIDQCAGIKHDIELSIFSHYKNIMAHEKLKIAWILAVKNIELTENDIERANSANIKIIDTSLLDYYRQLSEHLGPSSRFQFLHDMFPNRDIPHLLDPIPAIRGRMGTTTFYSFLMEPEQLFKIAYVSHRAKTNEDSLKTYQRMVQKNRIKKIAKYIHDDEGIFPTSIVLNIYTNRELRFDVAEGMSGKNATLGTLYIPNKYQIAWIIDGQHRLYGYSGLEEAKTATLPVIAFENLPAPKQAKLFVDINHEQVKVNKNLLIDLYATLHWNSENPQEILLALISRLIKELNDNSKSPFRDRIIKVDRKKEKSQNITMTSISDELYRSQLLGHVHSKRSKGLDPGYLSQEDRDATFTRAFDIISGYYWLYLEDPQLKKQWEAGSGDGGYLGTNHGVIATLRVLKEILVHLDYKDKIQVRTVKSNVLLKEIEKYIKPVMSYLSVAPFETLKQLRKRTGQAGVDASKFTLLSEINKVYPNFEPSGLIEFNKKIDTTNNEEAKKYLPAIEIKIHNHVIETLKTEFGPEINQWWHKGIKETIKGKVAAEATSRGDYNPENYPKYLYLVNLKEIISDNWKLFGQTYTIDAKPNESKVKSLAWFTKLNQIRDVCAHPPQGGISDDDLDFVKRIHDEICKRLPDTT